MRAERAIAPVRSLVRLTNRRGSGPANPYGRAATPMPLLQRASRKGWGVRREDHGLRSSSADPRDLSTGPPWNLGEGLLLAATSARENRSTSFFLDSARRSTGRQVPVSGRLSRSCGGIVIDRERVFGGRSALSMGVLSSRPVPGTRPAMLAVGVERAPQSPEQSFRPGAQPSE